MMDNPRSLFQDVAKRPMLKLANFADLTGPSDSSVPAVSDDVPSSGQACCSQCGKKNDKGYAAIVWETMQFCDEKCLGEHFCMIYTLRESPH